MFRLKYNNDYGVDIFINKDTYRNHVFHYDFFLFELTHLLDSIEKGDSYRGMLFLCSCGVIDCGSFGLIVKQVNSNVDINLILINGGGEKIVGKERLDKIDFIKELAVFKDEIKKYESTLRLDSRKTTLHKEDFESARKNHLKELSKIKIDADKK